jgi:hypothetical protein
VITSLVFFSVRDVYASVMVVTTGMALLFPGMADPLVLAGSLPLVALAALGSFLVLLGVHVYFSRRYATVMVMPDTASRS